MSLRWKRCPKCGQANLKDPLSDAVSRALAVVREARMTTNPDEQRRLRATFRATRGQARAAWKALEAELATLSPERSASPQPRPPRPASYRVPQRRRDPPPPEFRALARGETVTLPGSERRAPPPARSWPVAPPDEFRSLCRRLAAQPDPPLPRR